MPKTNTREDLPVVALSLPEIVAQTGFSRAFLYKQARLKKFRLRKVGAETFAFPSDVDRMLRNQPMATDSGLAA